MISNKSVWDTIWPIVEALIRATLAEDSVAIGARLAPDAQAAEALDLYGHKVFGLLLKTVLGRTQLNLTRVVEADDGRTLLIEYAWLDPEESSEGYSAMDAVTVRLQQSGDVWRVYSINPASADYPLYGARARGILADGPMMSDAEQLPSEPWVLPVAFYGGLLQIPLREEGMQDAVERRFLPGMQQRTYGMMAQLRARRLWRDFKAAAPTPGKPASWAAAVEFIMSQQEMRQLTQAAVARHYQIPLTAVAPRIKQIKKTLTITDLDERYTDLQTNQLVLET